MWGTFPRCQATSPKRAPRLQLQRARHVGNVFHGMISSAIQTRIPNPHPTPCRPSASTAGKPAAAHNIGRVTQVIGSTFDAEFPRTSFRASTTPAEDRRRAQGRHAASHRRGAAAPRRRQGAVRGPGLDRRPGPRHGRASTPAGRSRCRWAWRRSAACSTCWASRSTAAARSQADEYRPDPPRRRRTFDDLTPKTEMFETGIKVIDLLRPFVRGGKTGLFGGAGPGQDGHHPGADRPHRHASTAATRCSPASASAPAKATTCGWKCRRPKIGDTGQQRHRPHRDGLRPDERAAGGPPARGPVGPDHGRVLPRHDRRRHAAVHRQHLPLHPGRLRGVGPAGPHALGRGLPADAGHGDGRACRSGSPRPSKGAITSVQAVYVPADDLTDPAPATTFDAPGRVHRAGAVDRRRRASTRPSTRWPAPAAILDPQYVGRGALRRRPPGAADPPALPRPAGHHRDPGRRRAERRGQADRRTAPGGSSGSSPSRSSWPRCSPACRATSRRWPRRSAASRRSATASGTTCPSRRSCTSGPIEEAADQAKKMARRKGSNRPCPQLQCIVVTPERAVCDESVDFVSLPLYDGELGIGPGLRR